MEDAHLSARIIRLTCFSTAILAGLLAYWLMRLAVDQQPTHAPIDARSSKYVLVAKADIKVGTGVTPLLLRWQKWPLDAVQPQYLTADTASETPNRLVGMVVRSSIHAGEPVVLSKLSPANQGGALAALLKPGKRAVSTRITALTPAGDLLRPNDYVDVIFTKENRDNRAAAADFHSTTLVHNVRLVAVGDQFDPLARSERSEAKFVTLEVNPEEAERLAAAGTTGKLSLALRSSNTSGDREIAKFRIPRTALHITVVRYGHSSSFSTQH